MFIAPEEFYGAETGPLCDICHKPMAKHSGPGRPRKRHVGMCSDIERMRLKAQTDARRAERLAKAAAAA